ncbi:hypothetical protein WKW77_34110 [Variovorax ureilyticus]|uniref:Uncharacterized protein n=1 Tax=Variovorax ureilyticus TaxID=1836198 RepID=A0ABU8VR24_9BURK
MLSARHKAQILARAGYKVPPCPAPPQFGGSLNSPQSTTAEHRQHQAAEADKGGEPHAVWCRQIDILYSRYAAERAARSLREAEEARQLASTRRARDA